MFKDPFIEFIGWEVFVGDFGLPDYSVARQEELCTAGILPLSPPLQVVEHIWKILDFVTKR